MNWAFALPVLRVSLIIYTPTAHNTPSRAIEKVSYIDLPQLVDMRRIRNNILDYYGPLPSPPILSPPSCALSPDPLPRSPSPLPSRHEGNTKGLLVAAHLRCFAAGKGVGGTVEGTAEGIRRALLLSFRQAGVCAARTKGSVCPERQAPMAKEAVVMQGGWKAEGGLASASGGECVA